MIKEIKKYIHVSSGLHASTCLVLPSMHSEIAKKGGRFGPSGRISGSRDVSSVATSRGSRCVADAGLLGVVTRVSVEA